MASQRLPPRPTALPDPAETRPSTTMSTHAETPPRLCSGALGPTDHPLTQRSRSPVLSVPTLPGFARQLRRPPAHCTRGSMSATLPPGHTHNTHTHTHTHTHTTHTSTPYAPTHTHNAPLVPSKSDSEGRRSLDRPSPHRTTAAGNVCPTHTRTAQRPTSAEGGEWRRETAKPLEAARHPIPRLAPPVHSAIIGGGLAKRGSDGLRWLRLRL